MYESYVHPRHFNMQMYAEEEPKRGSMYESYVHPRQYDMQMYAEEEPRRGSMYESYVHPRHFNIAKRGGSVLGSTTARLG